MYLAIIEMRRAPVRYAIVAASVGLVLFLILAQQALQTALVASISGGIEHQSAEVLVFDVDAQRSPVGSFVPADLEAAVRDLDQVAELGVLRQSFATVESEHGSDEVAIVGYENGAPGSPRLDTGRLPASPGEVLVSEVAIRPTLEVGDRLHLARGGPPLQVTATAAGATVNQVTTIWMAADTYDRVFQHLHPDAPGPPTNVLALQARPDTTDDELVDAVNAIDPRLEALTREAAAAGHPQVEQIEQGFSMIFLLFALALPAIVGLFFMITTVQKAKPLILLRALGAPSGGLARALLLQVAVVVSAGVALGIGMFLPLTAVGIGGFPVAFERGSAVVWSGVVLVLGITSAGFSARRVLRMDPLEATAGGGLGV